MAELQQLLPGFKTRLLRLVLNSSEAETPALPSPALPQHSSRAPCKQIPAPQSQSCLATAPALPAASIPRAATCFGLFSPGELPMEGPHSPTGLHDHSLAGAYGIRHPASKEKLFHPSRETSSRKPPAKCLYQGAGRRSRGLEAAHPLWSGAQSRLFSAPRPAKREKSLCFSRN